MKTRYEKLAEVAYEIMGKYFPADKELTREEWIKAEAKRLEDIGKRNDFPY